MDNGLETNYFGATIFWSYNIAALGLTAVVLHTLASIRPTRDGSQECKRLTRVFSALAAISFCTLSFNMLNVLIQSYIQWPKRVPSGYIRSHYGLGDRIWTWSISSTLFRDFGEAIVADQARYLWVMSALMATFSVCSYMGFEGRRRGIPRLWAFFALSQILPISFAQNLFYIALIRQSPGSRPVAVQSLPSTVVFIVYPLILSIAPHTAQTSMLMPLIIAARLLLISQLLLVKSVHTGSQGPEITRRLQKPVAIAAGTLMLRQTFLALQENDLYGIGSALISHPAVSALGIDFILSAIGFIAWTFSGRWSDGVPSDRVKAR